MDVAKKCESAGGYHCEVHNQSLELCNDALFAELENRPVPSSDVNEQAALERAPIRLGLYKHFKGNLYRVTGEVILDGPRTRMVEYIPLYGNGEPTARDKNEFLSFVRPGVRRFEFIHD